MSIVPDLVREIFQELESGDGAAFFELPGVRAARVPVGAKIKNFETGTLRSVLAGGLVPIGASIVSTWPCG
jgi:hypothetical protein